MTYHYYEISYDGFVNVEFDTGWSVKEFNDYKQLRDRSLDYIWKFIKENKGDHDSFKGDDIPCLVASRFEKQIKRFAVHGATNTKGGATFNSIEEVIQYVKDKPFGIWVSRLTPDKAGYAQCYMEEYERDHNEFYSLNTKTVSYIKSFYDEDDYCGEETVDEYLPDPWFFKNLEDLRIYALCHLAEVRGFENLEDVGDAYVVRGHELTNLAEL